jgi:DnaJ-domain-containing protein 1
MLSKDDLLVIGEMIQASEKRLKQAILDSQEDTIETLKEYIDTAYNMQDERFKKIEDALDLPHPDKN